MFTSLNLKLKHKWELYEDIIMIIFICAICTLMKFKYD